MTTLEGPVLFARFVKLDIYQWTNPADGSQKPIISFMVAEANSRRAIGAATR